MKNYFIVIKKKIDEMITDYLCSLNFMHYWRPKIHGPEERLHWDKKDKKQNINCIFNTRSGHIYIGEETVISHNCMFLTGSHEFENGKLKQPKIRQIPDEGYDIRVGCGCWIASGVIITGKVTIGDNCKVAAGAVVTKSFPSGCILGGVPAKIIGYTTPTPEAVSQ